MKFFWFVDPPPKKLPFGEKTTEFLKSFWTKEILNPTGVKRLTIVKKSYFLTGLIKKFLVFLKYRTMKMKKYRKVEKPPPEIKKTPLFWTKNEFLNFLQFLLQILNGFEAK